MLPFISRVLATLLAASVISTSPHAAAPPQGDIVRMAPFKVREAKGVFEFDVRADDKTRAVQDVTVSWVSSWAHDKGLRVGDRLISIDGKPIADISFDELSDVMSRQLKEGETQKLFFTGRRFLGRPIKLTWTSRG